MTETTITTPSWVQAQLHISFIKRAGIQTVV